jgi:cell division protein FtsN
MKSSSKEGFYNKPNIVNIIIAVIIIIAIVAYAYIQNKQQI